MTSGITPWRISGSTITRLKPQSEHQHRRGAREQKREPQRRADGDEEQHRERGEHHELALREVDDAGRLPQQREAERREGVDRAGRDAGHDELNQVAHEGLGMERAIAFAHRGSASGAR